MFRFVSGYLSDVWSGTSTSDKISQAIDIKIVKFDPGNSTHTAFINQRIQDFITRRDQLINFDIKVGIPAGVTLLWLSGLLGSWGGYLSAISIVGAYLYAPKDLRRDHMQQEFVQALDELFALYRWSAVDQQRGIKYDPRFIELVQTIAPFTRDPKKLVAWDAALQNDLLIPEEDPNSYKWIHFFAVTQAQFKRTLYGKNIASDEGRVLQPQLK
jgi:hypothetical protein